MSMLAQSRRMAMLPARRGLSVARTLRAETPPVVVNPVVPPVVPPRRRRVGAFRGGFFGFLLGTVLTGTGAYYYVFDQYRAANAVVLTDVIKLEESIRKLEDHVSAIEKKTK